MCLLYLLAAGNQAGAAARISGADVTGCSQILNKVTLWIYQFGKIIVHSAFLGITERKLYS